MGRMERLFQKWKKILKKPIKNMEKTTTYNSQVHVLCFQNSDHIYSICGHVKNETNHKKLCANKSTVFEGFETKVLTE